MSNDKGAEIELVRIDQGKKEKVSDLVAKEITIAIEVNKEELIRLSCSPGKIKYLAVGFLLTSGILTDKEEILSMQTRKNLFQIEIKNFQKPYSEMMHLSRINGFKDKMKTTDQGVTLNTMKNAFEMDHNTVYSLISKMEDKSIFFKRSGGVHSCGLADAKGFIHFFCEDVSRYNTIDRIFGEAFLKNFYTGDKIILTSCRISSGIMERILVGNVSMVISRSAVTDYAIQLAQQKGITLIGFARKRKMNIYTHPERVML